MALEIGGGITIGGNITVTIETSGANAPGAPTIGTATRASTKEKQEKVRSWVCTNGV